MKTLSLIQGSDEWKSIRGQYVVASEAPIMMGDSPNMSRDDLLKYKTTGDEQEITRFQLIIFGQGHEYEAAARPIAEALLQDELYPVTGVAHVDGLNMLASFDGLTMMEDNHWEHKQFNKELFARVKSGGELEGKHYWQLEHQMLVNGNNSCVFAVSDGTAENYAQIVYHSRPERREQLIHGWKQFLADLVNYEPIVIEPKAIAEPVATLPAISFKTEFMGTKLVLTSNLNAYKAAASKLVEQSKEVLKTDQDFANAEARIKSCKDAEERIAHIQQQVLGEVADIDQFTRDLTAISDMLRQCRLNEDKQVKQRKEEIRLGIINDVKVKFQEHVNTINAAIALANVSFPTISLPAINVDFLSAIKGKKTVKSLIESANDELARGKIEANRIAGIIDSNLELLNMIAVGYDGLFADIQQLVLKDKEALNAIAQQRINAHKVSEQEKIQAAAKKIADEQIERDRQAEAQRVADLAKQNEVVAPAVQAPFAQSEPVAAASTASVRQSFGGGGYGSSHIDRSSAAQAPAQTVQPQVTTEQCPSHEVQLNDYQKGMIAGLEMSVRIHANCLRSGMDFITAINAVCTSDNIPAAPISKAA